MEDKNKTCLPDHTCMQLLTCTRPAKMFGIRIQVEPHVGPVLILLNEDILRSERVKGTFNLI